MTFNVVLEVDPDAVRQARAESDVTVGEIMRKPTTVAAAFRERAKEIISGTISITFSTDSAGNILRRTKVAKVETKEPDGRIESQTTTETVERRLMSGHPVQH